MISRKHVLWCLAIYVSAVIGTVIFGFVSGFPDNPDMARERIKALDKVALSTATHPITSENLDKIYSAQGQPHQTISAEGSLFSDAVSALRWNRVLFGVMCAILLFLIRPPIKESALTGAGFGILLLCVGALDVAAALLLSTTLYILLSSIFSAVHQRRARAHKSKD